MALAARQRRSCRTGFQNTAHSSTVRLLVGAKASLPNQWSLILSRQAENGNQRRPCPNWDSLCTTATRRAYRLHTAPRRTRRHSTAHLSKLLSQSMPRRQICWTALQDELNGSFTHMAGFWSWCNSARSVRRPILTGKEDEKLKFLTSNLSHASMPMSAQLFNDRKWVWFWSDTAELPMEERQNFYFYTKMQVRNYIGCSVTSTFAHKN